jgi:hypothetical protein
MQGAKGMPPDVAAAARRIATWRETRTARRVPEWAWAAAVRVAARHGVSVACRALRLDYYEIQRRLASRRRRSRRRRTSSPTFVEIAPGAVGGGDVGTVEIADALGRRLRVAVPGGMEGIERLVRFFLDRPA